MIPGRDETPRTLGAYGKCQYHYENYYHHHHYENQIHQLTRHLSSRHA